ncbi:MAG: type II toxin-antitoxin system PemK/MazF family toxin [Peptostreptococcaceae bacterium]|nr:type II toxin-antitoxin system PemK/MazF family toxin [Peptostreptococcaceae bacterium]
MNKTELETLRKQAITDVENALTTMCESEDLACQKRASLLSYWLIDFMRFLKKEDTFDPLKIIKYRRGDIVKVHLGFNVGREEGGLHYGVVIDNNNSASNSTITIIPLSSIRVGRKIHHTSVEIGNEVFKSIMSKHDKLENEVNTEISVLVKELEELRESLTASPASHSPENVQKLKILDGKINDLQKMDNNLKVLKAQILKMKEGSVALTSQIKTISKLRIYDPIYSHHVLYGVRLTPTTLSKINDKIKELYIYCK